MRLPALTAKLSAMFMVLTLAACGGGGDGGAGTDATPSAAPAAITSTNMETVAGLTVSLAGADLRTATQAGNAVTGARLESSRVPAMGMAARVAMDAFVARVKVPAAIDLASGATVQRSEDCSVAGSIEVTLTSADATLLTLDAGDSAVLDFQACDEGEGVIEGRLTVNILGFSGRLESDGSAILRVRFADLRISDGGNSLTANGEMLIDLNVSSGALTASVDSTSMRYTLGAEGALVEVTVREGSISFTENLVSGTTVTLSEDFVAVTPGFSGGAVISTETPLVVGPDDDILSGRLRVTGLESTLFLSFLEAGAVLLELDRDNDSLIDISRLSDVALLPLGLP